MQKAEAIAITNILQSPRQDVQEVRLRLKMHVEGKLTMSDDSQQNAMERLEHAIDAVDLVLKMAYSELD